MSKSDKAKIPTLQERYNNVVRDYTALLLNFKRLNEQHDLSNSRAAWFERDLAKATEDIGTAEETTKHYQAMYEAACQRADTLARRCDYYQTLAPKSDVNEILDTGKHEHSGMFIFKLVPEGPGEAINYVVVAADDYSAAVAVLNSTLSHDFEFCHDAVASQFQSVALLTDISNI